MSDTSTDTPKKKTTSRAEAGLVEEDFEAQPNDEAISNQEQIDWEAQDEAGGLIETLQSNVVVSGMSEEEQGMEMTPAIVGPPGYGSPDPITSAGRLLPLDQHPFNPANLPEDHPAAIDEFYGEGYQGNLSPSELGSQFPGAPQRTDLERDLQGTGEEGASATTAQAQSQSQYEAQTRADLLTEAESRGLTGLSNATKAEIITALMEDDAAA
jgi:hypothetical protein